MMPPLPRSLPHLVVTAGLGGLILFVNASSTERPLRALDRDFYSSVRRDRPDLLRSHDLRSLLGTPWVNLTATDLSGQDLRALRMSGNLLRDLNLQGGHLEEAEFACVSMHRVNFSGAHLSGARFDYSNCGPGRRASIGEQRLFIDLQGADLSHAELRGSVSQPNAAGRAASASGAGRQSCQSRLTIIGNLNGANFSGAMLQCVTLRNTASTRLDEPSSPSYAGLNFYQAKLNDLELASGDFRFSDFYAAQLDRLTFNPDQVHLGFSTLASLQCPDDGCQLWQTPSSGSRERQRFALNLRDSRISANSNWQLPQLLSPQGNRGWSTQQSWPALLCNAGSSWTSPGSRKPSQVQESPAPRFWVQTNAGPVCAPLPSPS